MKNRNSYQLEKSLKTYDIGCYKLMHSQALQSFINLAPGTHLIAKMLTLQIIADF